MLNLNKFKNFWKRRKQKPVILVFIDLIQDFDVLLPLIEAIEQHRDLTAQVCVSDWVVEKSPRVEKILQSLGIKYVKIPHQAMDLGMRPGLLNVRAVITASETTAPPHLYPHLLTKRANELGIPTYTLQHGLENIGLTYFDEVHSAETIHFASQKILIWGDLNSLSPESLEETRSRCVPVGCPKAIIPQIENLLEIPHKRDYLVAIFENLHWHRYRDSYRSYFLEHLQETASQFSNTTFLVKPHHAGQWLTKRYRGTLPESENLIVINPNDLQWEPFTAPALIQYADAIVTTPSTVALDAARLTRPVSVIGYDLELPVYAPLPILRSLEDWMNFVKTIQTSAGKNVFEKQAQSFVNKVIFPGDAIEQILTVIEADIHSKK